jgi:HEAT repeat protein
MKAADRRQFLVDAKEQGRKDLAPQILQLISDRDPHVRQLVISALRELEVPEALTAARIACGDANDWVRDEAVETLGQIGKRSDLHRLLTAAKDPHWIVRCSAMASLCQLGGKTAVAAVVRSLHKDPNEIVRSWAAYWLLEVEGTQPELEKALAYEKEGRTRAAIISSLLTLGRTDLLPDFYILLDDDWYVTKGVVVKDIGDMIDEGIIKDIPRALREVEMRLKAGRFEGTYVEGAAQELLARQEKSL